MATTVDDAFVPFRFDIPENELADLYGRLDHARWPDELPGVGWGYGVPRDYLTECRVRSGRRALTDPRACRRLQPRAAAHTRLRPLRTDA
jgi:hypothetical protein